MFLNLPLSFSNSLSWCSWGPVGSGPVPPQSWISEPSGGTVFMADAGVDHHDGSLQRPARATAEGHLSSGGLVRRTAAGVGALPAVPQPVGPSAVAALMNEPDVAW